MPKPTFLSFSKDTAGTERFSTVSRNYYRHVDGAMIVYDASRPGTLGSVQRWYDNLESSSSPQASMCVAVIGNKSDSVSLLLWCISLALISF